jgi:hypothetical protein
MKISVSKVFLILGVLAITASVLLLGAVPALTQEDGAAAAQGEPGTFLTGYFNAWVNSPHARYEDGAFRHWDEEAEAVIPERCAACHSTPGFLDYLGVDGSEAGVVNAPAPLGSVINCDACHNRTASSLTSVTFPSGAEISGLGDSGRCMICHQGRASGVTVATAIENAGLADEPNTVSEDLRFINIHFYAAASTIYGSAVTGGYEYEGKAYNLTNRHAEGYSECASCHSPHSLELKLTTCATCHEGVETVEDVRAIRSVGSMVDYDGDGDMEEGILGEIETLQEMLYQVMQTYSSEVVGTPLVYNGDAYPYMFADTDGDGVGDEGFNQFTPALLRAAYNYQMSKKDLGGYAHNPDYIIQLLFDSIESLNAEVSEGVDLSMASRDSFGHFNETSGAFRHWDADGEVSASCSKCHTADGLPFFIEHGVTIAMAPTNSLSCETCHMSLADDAPVFMVPEVTFPSGAVISFGEDSPNNICLECHQGRESGVSIQNALNRAAVGDDEVSEALRFINPHYFATGASLFGAEANGAYQYPDMEYNGRNTHTRAFDECSDCHEQHSAEIRFEECTECHMEVSSAETVADIRSVEDADRDPVDFNGNGDVEEPIKAELDALHDALYAEILDYAANVVGTPIGTGGGFPYWFIDTNGDGTIDAEEGQRANAYVTWTPTLTKAVYNYQFVYADPGSYAHNPEYIIQVLYDTLADIGGEEAVASYTRPEVRSDD